MESREYDRRLDGEAIEEILGVVTSIANVLCYLRVIAVLHLSMQC
jgi:hypothetical protein